MSAIVFLKYPMLFLSLLKQQLPHFTVYCLVPLSLFLSFIYFSLFPSNNDDDDGGLELAAIFSRDHISLPFNILSWSFCLSVSHTPRTTRFRYFSCSLLCQVPCLFLTFFPVWLLPEFYQVKNAKPRGFSNIHKRYIFQAMGSKRERCEC